MIIENSTLSVGGNSIFVFLGKQISKLGAYLTEKGEKIITRNKTKYVTNPTATLVSPFILIINFTVDITEKYHIVLQGDYKQNFKESIEGSINLSEEELFMIINNNQPLWFKKY